MAKPKSVGKLPSGVKLVRTLRGHTFWIGRIAWSSDGRMLASPSNDKTVRLWDTNTGMCLRTLKHDKDQVWSVAFDPASRILASGSWDKAVKLWDTGSGRLLGTLAGHKHAVTSVAFDPAGRTLASGGEDGTVKLWEVASGRILQRLQGHRKPVSSIAFHPAAGRILASGSWDKTVKLWEVASGQLLRTLEGHTGGVNSVDFLFDGSLLASKGDDHMIRLWSSDTGACLGRIPEPSSTFWRSGLAFHPHLPLLATVGSDLGALGDECDRVIHVWELDLAVLLGQPVAPTVTYTSAKVVLVGESNVGKSYLAHRIASGSPPEEGTIRTTHGMKFWPLKAERLCPSAKAPKGQYREVVLWDMGGQEEYRLIHQLFLDDTTVALILVDPTRGSSAFKEAETWNKYLDKQLHGRATVRLLVGAKLDKPSNCIDHQGLERLCRECGFAGFYESSALTGRGLTELCDAVAKAIDWDGIGQTSRPELFQAIRDEIESRRRNGMVVVLFGDLEPELCSNDAIMDLMLDEVAMASDADAGVAALDTVCRQLSQQGIISDTRTGGGERALVLRVEEVERYAGSLIVAARNNPRGVPALELRAIAQADFLLPGIADEERLPREQEKPVLECTVQLMLERGICFQHEGLLIFPTLFVPAPAEADAKLPHAVSLYYDFAGAIDNIYASLVAWLVLARDFGRVRLWSDRAELEVKDGGLCGLRKVARPGGFAHVDVYFEADTPRTRRGEFITFVEEHLRQNGVEIHEHVAIKCPCGHQFQEETLRQRIARGDKDVACPVCETRHGLSEGAAESRRSRPGLTEWTWALKTEIEKRRQESTEQAVQVLEQAASKIVTGPIRLLHLSDLHFDADTQVQARLQPLSADLRRIDCLKGPNIERLDYLVVSGDFTDRGHAEGFEKAYEFVSALTQEFGLSAERCIFVPGNHDVKDLAEAFELREGTEGQKVSVRSSKYPERFKPFSDGFFHKFLQKPYPLAAPEQSVVISFWETGIQFLALNSCWQIDEYDRKRSAIHPEAVANALSVAHKQETDARASGQLKKDGSLLRIAIWHHAVAGPEMMQNVDFLENLTKAEVRLGLHGDVHEVRRSQDNPWEERTLYIAGAGAFGAAAKDRPESTPRLYNLLEIERDLKSTRVHTRRQSRPDGAWDGFHEWPDPDGGKGRVAYYDINW